MKPISPRVQKTRNSIREALQKMLVANNIHKISIRELCRLANINHTTFYNHYGNQYDVLNDIASIYIKNTSQAVKCDLDEGKDIVSCLISVLTFMKENQTFVKLIFFSDNYDLVNEISAVLPSFDQEIMKQLPEEMSHDFKEALASYVQYGALYLIKSWIMDGCYRDVKEESELILSIAGRTILGK